MSDEQTWIIATAPADVSDRQLADALGLKQSAVHARRWTLREKGWTCRVRFATCLHCGEAMTLPPSNPRSDHPYHQDCKPEADRARQRRYYRHQSADALQRERLQSREVVASIQESTLQRAVNRGALWTDSEDAHIEATLHLPVAEVAADIGRTYYSVNDRRKRIRRMKADDSSV